MTALSAREDVQSGLLAPGTSPLDQAWAHLLREAELSVRRTGDAVLHGAVVGVKEARRG